MIIKDYLLHRINHWCKSWLISVLNLVECTCYFAALICWPVYLCALYLVNYRRRKHNHALQWVFVHLLLDTGVCRVRGNHRQLRLYYKYQYQFKALHKSLHVSLCGSQYQQLPDHTLSLMIINQTIKGVIRFLKYLIWSPYWKSQNIYCFIFTFMHFTFLIKNTKLKKILGVFKQKF